MFKNEYKTWQLGALVGLILDGIFAISLLLIVILPTVGSPIFNALWVLRLPDIIRLPILGSVFNFTLIGMVVGKLIDLSDKKRLVSKDTGSILTWAALIAFLVIIAFAYRP